MFRTWLFKFFLTSSIGEGTGRRRGGTGSRGGIRMEGGSYDSAKKKNNQPRSLRSKHHVDVAALVVGNNPPLSVTHGGKGRLVHRCPSRSPALPVTSAHTHAHTHCSSPLRDSTIFSSPAILLEGIDAHWAL